MARPAEPSGPGDLAGKTVLVTGATPGSLGFETARLLAERGAEVVVTTRRTTADAVAAQPHQVTGHDLDLADAGSVREFANWFRDTHEQLDVLVNNAGIHLDLRSTWREPRLVDGHEVHWRTNYLGSAQLTRELLPMLLARAGTTGDARVVNVVSKLHERGRNEFLFTPITPYNSWVAYGTSKLALVHDAAELARRHGAAGLRAFSLHPGSVYTHIADRGLDGHRFLGAARRLAAPLERRALLSPAAGARTSVLCAATPDAASGYYRAGRPAEPSADARDPEVAQRLWAQTEAWLATA